MGADALPRLRTARVPNDLDQRRWALCERRVEDLRRAAEGGRPVPQQGARHLGHLGIPLGDEARQIRHRGRPLIGTLQPQILGPAGPTDGRELGPDVDLLAPIDFASGQFPAQPGVAAKVRTAHHRDRVLISLGQRKQPPRGVEHPGHQRGGHAVADEIKEAHLVGGPPQTAAQLAGIGAQIHYRKGRDAPHICHLLHHRRR